MMPIASEGKLPEGEGGSIRPPSPFILYINWRYAGAIMNESKSATTRKARLWTLKTAFSFTQS